MMTANYQNEVDLMDFAKNIFFRRRKLCAGLFLCVLISIVTGFVMPIQHRSCATVQIGVIREPMLRRIDVENKLTDPQTILPLLRKFDRGLSGKKIKDIIVVEDMEPSDVVKLSVKYPDTKASVDICNSIAELFVAQGSAVFIKKKNLLEEGIGRLQEINRRNKDKMDSLFWLREEQQAEKKVSTAKKIKKGKAAAIEETIKVDNADVQMKEDLILYYHAASLAAAEKIAGLKNELIDLKNEYMNGDLAYYEKKAFLITEMISVFEELDHYYGMRIINLSKHPAGVFMSFAQARELMKYENNYSLYLDEIFALKKQVLSARGFEVVQPAVFSIRQVLTARYNRLIVSGCFGFVAGLLLIFIREFFTDELREICRTGFVQRRKFSYAGS